MRDEASADVGRWRDFGNVGNTFLRLIPLLKSPRFWASQAAVIGIAVAHDLLERLGGLSDEPIDFLPVTLYWVPLVYMALTFGTRGVLITATVALLATIPNWLIMGTTATHAEEIITLAIAIVTAVLIGREADRRREARRSAEIYAAAAVRSQEGERKRLSLELHDESIQELMAICHELDLLEGPSQEKTAGIRKSVDSVVQKLRQMSTSLRPPVLEDLGAVPAVRGMLTQMAHDAGFSEKLTIDGEQRRLPTEVELALFRIAQESMRNAAKHAQASRVLVGITFGRREVVLEVTDDGKGFNPGAIHGLVEGHLGLLGMKERAEMTGGRLEIYSRVGEGTRITAHFPLSSDRPATS